MSHYLFLARSVTHAQELAKVLGSAGVPTKIHRASPGLTERGCGYSLEVSEQRFMQAQGALLHSGKKPVKVFHVSDGQRREVDL